MYSNLQLNQSGHEWNTFNYFPNTHNYARHLIAFINMTIIYIIIRNHQFCNSHYHLNVEEKKKLLGLQTNKSAEMENQNDKYKVITSLSTHDVNSSLPRARFYLSYLSFEQ